MLGVSERSRLCRCLKKYQHPNDFLTGESAVVIPSEDPIDRSVLVNTQPQAPCARRGTSWGDRELGAVRFTEMLDPKGIGRRGTHFPLVQPRALFSQRAASKLPREQPAALGNSVTSMKVSQPADCDIRQYEFMKSAIRSRKRNTPQSQ